MAKELIDQLLQDTIQRSTNWPPAMKLSIYFAALALVVASSGQLLIVAGGGRQDIIASRRKQNFFADPIYAFDDVDTHTVSLAATQNQDVNGAKPRETPKPKPKPELLPVVRSFVASQKNSTGSSSSSSREAAAATERQQPLNLNRATQKRSYFEDVSPTAVSPTGESSATGVTLTKAAVSSALGSNQYALTDDLSIVSAAQQRPVVEQKHHWSGLENYYKLLQQQQQQQQPQIDAFYQISQEPAHHDNPLGWSGLSNRQQQMLQPVRSGPIILFPNYNVGQSLPTNKPQSSFSFPYDQSYVPSGSIKGSTHQISPTPHSQVPPQYSSDHTIVQANVYDRDTIQVQDLNLMSAEELRRLVIKNNLLSKQPFEQRKYSLADGMPSILLSGGGSGSNPSAAATGDLDRRPLFENGRVIHQEPTKLHEYMDIQRKKQRFRHQQETFGSIYDSQRMREQYQEDIYCRARNQVNIRLAPSSSGGGATNQTTFLNSEQLSRLSQLRIDPSVVGGSVSQDVTVQLSAGEFPSHMGLYNGTPGEDNFLCAATWVDDGFAITVATCVESLNPKLLTARFGEWNLNKPNSSQSNQQQQQQRMFSSPVKEIIIFPKYNKNNSLEHNLALIKFEQPINFLQVPYASPACQREPRNSFQRAKSCWAPVRNITLGEYFDADGEGETREKKNVAMIELPVKLIADDDTECLKQSGIELFNFNHPNYICSADYRRAPWRAKLNQSDYFGSGIYCNEGGNLSLVSLLHPIGKNSTTAIGYLDLSYYRPWMRSVIFAQK